jgi:hypothetical protein
MGAVTTEGSAVRSLPLPLISIAGFFVAVVLAGLSYLLLSLVSADFARTVAGFVLTAASGGVISYLKERQMKAERAAASAEQRPVARFTLKWYVTFLYGTLALIGVTQLFASLASFFVAFLVAWDEMIIAAVSVVNSLILWPIFAFFLGRWIGKRCERFCVLLAPIILLLVNFLNSMSTLLLPESMLLETLGTTRAELLAGFLEPVFLGFFFGGLLLQTLSALVGYWWGYRSRASTHLLDLLSVLPPDTRTTIVDLVYEEATT